MKREVYIKVVRQTWDEEEEPLVEEFHLTPAEIIDKLLWPELEERMREWCNGNTQGFQPCAGGSIPPSRTSDAPPVGNSEEFDEDEPND